MTIAATIQLLVAVAGGSLDAALAALRHALELQTAGLTPRRLSQLTTATVNYIWSTPDPTDVGLAFSTTLVATAFAARDEPERATIAAACARCRERYAARGRD